MDVPQKCMVIYGYLWTQKGNLFRNFLSICESRYNYFEVEMLRYFIKGASGFYICIPAKIFGGEEGYPHLNILHSLMISRLAYFTYEDISMSYVDILNYIDRRELRKPIEEVIRGCKILLPDSCDSTEITPEIFFNEYPQLLTSLCGGNNTSQIQPNSSVQIEMKNIFNRVQIYNELILKIPKSTYIFHCSFLDYCFANTEHLTESQWAILRRLMNQFNEIGEAFIQGIRSGIKGLPPEVSSNLSGGIIHYDVPNCSEIKMYFECPSDCECSSLEIDYQPIDNNRESTQYQTQFFTREDGLYYSPSYGKEDDFFIISSPMRIIGYVNDTDKKGWERLVEVTNPLGIKQRISIPFEDCVGKCDTLVALLSRYGWLAKDKDAQKLISLYMRSYIPRNYYLKTARMGWYNDSAYIFPDEVIGEQTKYKTIYDGPPNLFNVSGDHKQWVDNVGRYCHKNPLLMFLVQYALTGPLLKPTEMEGGGIHIYGRSSSGKSTLAMVAGSVCGGVPHHGFLRQWRSTANSLEKIATLHNDSFLVLDEISQATPEAVYDTVYMLSNRQGKARMNSKSELQSIFSWNVNYLSTGELPIKEKIEESNKRVAMAGQEIRVIDVPIDNDDGINVFQSLHGFDSPAKLSIHLKDNARLFYGTSLRLFLKQLIGNGNDLGKNIEKIKKCITKFMENNTKAMTNGQVTRVAQKFALISAVGSFAAENEIFPWTSDEAEEVVQNEYIKWFSKRGGDSNLEVENAIKRLYEYIGQYEYSRFIFDEEFKEPSMIRDFSGYKQESETESIFYINTSKFRNIVGNSYYNSVIKTMIERKLLIMDTNNKRLKEFYHPKPLHNYSRCKIRAHGIIVRNTDNISNL